MEEPGRNGSSAPRSPLLRMKLIVAWTLVGIPLAWGVSQVVVKSLDLFR